MLAACIDMKAQESLKRDFRSMTAWLNMSRHLTDMVGNWIDIWESQGDPGLKLVAILRASSTGADYLIVLGPATECSGAKGALGSDGGHPDRSNQYVRFLDFRFKKLRFSVDRGTKTLRTLEDQRLWMITDSLPLQKARPFLIDSKYFYYSQIYQC